MKHLIVILLTLLIFQSYDNYRLREYNNFLEANYDEMIQARENYEKAGEILYNTTLEILPSFYILKETENRLDSTYSILKEFDREQLVAYFTSNDTSLGNRN